MVRIETGTPTTTEDVFKAICYEIQEGPLEEIGDLDDVLTRITHANCQLTTQLVQAVIFEVYLPKKAVLSQEGARSTGICIARNSFNEPHEADFFANLQPGDMVWAEYKRENGPKRGTTEWEKKQHVATYLGFAGDPRLHLNLPSLNDYPADARMLIHATDDEGRICYCTVEQFTEKYIPTVARRVPNRFNGLKTS